ncbi:MAG: cobyric acid synthase, partial [Deltaproteobacteria bacterium]
IFDAPGFRADFLNRIRVSKGLKQRPARRGRLVRFREYDKLADHFEAHCDVERILEVMSELK